MRRLLTQDNHCVQVRYLEQLLPKCTVVPAVNQIENHPYLPQQDIVDFCREKGILIEAYSPLGSTGSPVSKPIANEQSKRRGGRRVPPIFPGLLYLLEMLADSPSFASSCSKKMQ